MTCLAPSDVVDFYKKNMANYSPRKDRKPPLLSSLKEISPPLLTMAFDDATNVDQKLTFALHVPTFGHDRACSIENFLPQQLQVAGMS